MATPREKNATDVPGRVILPVLGPNICIQTVPRRYEETKLVINQDFTHRQILDLGKHFHKETVKKLQNEKLEAVRTAEEAARAKAEAEKQNALWEVTKKAQKEHEKAIRKLQKQHQRALLEEAVRIQGAMELEKTAAVQRASEEGERKLERAVQETELRLNALYTQKEKDAREEERSKTALQAERIARENEEKFQNAMKSVKEEKLKELAELKATCQREKEFAVAHAHSREQVKLARKLTEVRHSYEEKLDEVTKYVGALQEILNNTSSSLEAEKLLSTNLVQELMETRAEFQKFLNRTKPFCPGESDYLIPPVRSTDVTKYLESTSN